MGEGWFTLLFSEGKCNIWMVEMYNNARIVSVHRSQQLDNLQGIILDRFTQVNTSCESPHQRGVKHIDYWVIHNRFYLHGTPQQMTGGLMMGPQHRSQWLTAVLKQGNRGMAEEVNSFMRWFHDVKPKAMWPQIGRIWGSPMELTGEVDLIARTSLWPPHCQPATQPFGQTRLWRSDSERGKLEALHSKCCDKRSTMERMKPFLFLLLLVMPC